MNYLPILAVACSVLVVSCATKYGPAGPSGGYSETRYSPDVAKIIFKGNGVTSRDQAQDYSLLRAGELCLQLGYKYILVGSDNVDFSSSTITTPGYSTTSGAVYGVSPYGANYSQNTVSTPGQTITVNKPEAWVIVKFLHEKPKGVSVIDAAFIVTSLKEKYHLK